MAYYIFLKSLRSLEEFRKNPHVKIPPKSRSKNFQSLGKFKNPIFNSQILFLAFGPADLTACSASGPTSPPAAPFPQAKIVLAGPSSPRVSRVFTENTFSLSDQAFLSQPPLPRLSVNRGPPVRFTPFPTPADPGRKSPAPPLPRAAAPRLGCPRAFTALPHHSLSYPIQEKRERSLHMCAQDVQITRMATI
jgi:hypothetical protein